MTKKRYPDMRLFFLTLALLVIGVLMVYDASYARAAHDYHGDSMHFLKLQATWAVLGLAMMFVTMRIRFWKLKPYATWFLLLSVVALLMVFMPGIGHQANGASRWIDLRVTKVQPSELAKFCVAIYVAYVLSTHKMKIRDTRELIVRIGIPVALVGVLIVVEDMGTAIVLFGSVFAMLFVGGARSKHLMSIAMLAVVFAGLMTLAKPYRAERMMTFIDPFKDQQGKGYQVCQSLISLGSGGIRGMGFCEGRQKLFYLPEEHTDFIFAVLGQEGGLIGTLIVSGLFLLFGVYGLQIAAKTKDGFGRSLAGGLTIMICGQALLNMLVVTSTVPATGVPLPFISYGGSSLVINLMCVGMLLGISKYQGQAIGEGQEEGAERSRGSVRASGGPRSTGASVSSSRRRGVARD